MLDKKLLLIIPESILGSIGLHYLLVSSNLNSYIKLQNINLLLFPFHMVDTFNPIYQHWFVVSGDHARNNKLNEKVKYDQY